MEVTKERHVAREIIAIQIPRFNAIMAIAYHCMPFATVIEIVPENSTKTNNQLDAILTLSSSHCYFPLLYLIRIPSLNVARRL